MSDIPKAGRFPTSNNRHIVARVSDVGPGQRIKLTLGHRAIALFNIEGEFFAIGDTCPHEFGSLCKGKLVGLAQSDIPGEYRLERKGEFVKCPWHGWEFDIRTGQSYCDPQTMRVRTFAATVAKGADILANETGITKGPYVAETFPVHVEDDYVIIEV
jgi:nitrite reductase/ring-hydroxylating ferredoxin subunit